MKRFLIALVGTAIMVLSLSALAADICLNLPYPPCPEGQTLVPNSVTFQGNTGNCTWACRKDLTHCADTVHQCKTGRIQTCEVQGNGACVCKCVKTPTCPTGEEWCTGLNRCTLPRDCILTNP